MDFSAVLEIIKALGAPAIMELVKSNWIKFSIGLSMLMLTGTPFIHALAAFCK